MSVDVHAGVLRGIEQQRRSQRLVHYVVAMRFQGGPDLIVTADGETLAASTDLIRIRRRHLAGDTLTLVIERDGRRFTAEIVLRALTA